MPTTAPPELTAPFAPGGEASVDPTIARRLLSLALESGGDAADLYFEFRVTADYALQEEQVKTVGRGVTLGHLFDHDGRRIEGIELTDRVTQRTCPQGGKHGL